MKETNYCQDIPKNFCQDLPPNLCSSDILEPCRILKRALEEGGGYGPGLSLPLFLLLNAGVSVVAFGVVYSLTFLLPALARRYWRWLNT